MSYDISIGDKSFNYTSNVGPMFFKAAPNHGINIINNLSGSLSIKVLRTMREYFENNRGELEKLNPENGWGDYDGALTLLNSLIRAAIEYPDDIWDVRF